MDPNPSIVPPAPDVSAGEGENAPSPEGGTDTPSPEETALKQINESSGRNYTTLDEALKGMKETYSFVGSEALKEIRDKAKKFDLSSGPPTHEEKTEKFYGKVDRMEFLQLHPEAKEYTGLISAIAKDQDVSWEDAFESDEGKKVQTMIKRDQEESEPANPPFVTSGQRLPEGQTGLTKEEFSKLPLEEQKKIIDKLPGWLEPFPKGTFKSSPQTSGR